MAEMTDKIEEESAFYNWLKSAALDKHYRRLSENRNLSFRGCEGR